MEAVGVGLIGYGNAGAVFHAPLLRAEPRLRLAAVVSSRSEQVARGVEGARVVATPSALFEDPAIDLVVIAAPNAAHASLARMALDAGKHVVVDKPLTPTAAEADALISLAAARGRMLTVFQNRRWDGDFLTVMRLVRDGLLGDVSYVESHFDRFRPAIQAGWREVPGEGSGVLYDLGAHLVDQALVLLGTPTSVSADVLAQRTNADVVDYFHVVLGYGTRRVVLHASTLAPGPGPRFVVHGDGGSFVKYGLDGQENALRSGVRPGARDWGREPPERFGMRTGADGVRTAVETAPGSYEAFYAGVAACLLDGAAPPVDARDARTGLRVIEAAMQSAAEQRVVVLVLHSHMRNELARAAGRQQTGQPNRIG
jgi:scyllo-inositol 2-dehydrogenase (NADP+)